MMDPFLAPARWTGTTASTARRRSIAGVTPARDPFIAPFILSFVVLFLGPAIYSSGPQLLRNSRATERGPAGTWTTTGPFSRQCLLENAGQELPSSNGLVYVSPLMVVSFALAPLVCSRLVTPSVLQTAHFLLNVMVTVWGRR